VPHADLDTDGTIIVETSYVDRHLIRQLPGSKYNGKTQKWNAPLSWGTCVALRALFGDKLEVGEMLNDWSWNEFKARVDPCAKLRELTEIPELGIDGGVNENLYPFQQVGALFMAIAGQGLLAESMGSGKTAQTIGALKIIQEVDKKDVFPALVVCPNGIKYTWEREFAKWWPGIRVSVASGGAAGRRKALAEEADVYVINYDAVRLHSRLASYGQISLKRCQVCEPELCPKVKQTSCEWCPRELNTAGYKTVIADEAHRLKEPKAKWTRAVWSIAHGPTVERRYALTGTPTEKNAADLWALMHLVSPLEFPTKSKYVDRYVETSFNFFGGMEMLGLNPATKDELFKIVDPRMRRLPKKVILPQLPDKVYTTIEVEMAAKQAKAYREMEEYMAARLDEEILTAANPLVKVGRLMQFASAYAQLVEVVKQHATGSETMDIHVELADPSNKVDALVELLEDLDDEPLVVFSASKKLVKLANERLVKLKIVDEKEYPVLVTGDQAADERQRRVDAFQAGKQRVLLCTHDAAGEGLTMTRASKLVFLNRHWSALKNAQAEDRVHRIGSEIHDSVEIIDIISKDTVEERQREALGGKLERLEEVVRDRVLLLKLLGAV
jgi:SNF2 family DNA or RNA helicase